jgi:hypothetical protein
MVTKAEVWTLLTRLLRNGPIEQLPKKQAEADILFALAAAALDSGRTYDEHGINDHLTAWLERFASPFGVDHVTVRRSMVDAGFLNRNASGGSYSPVAERIGQVLAPDARSVSPGDVLMDLDLARQARKRAHEQKSDR